MSYAKTAVEQLEKWDAGETIWSIEMGGLGPGYEQAIQILAIEMVRDNLTNPATKENWAKWGDKTVTRIDYKKPDGSYACGGFSGEQVGAAKQIASSILREGPEKAFAEVPGDRMIQVSRTWPEAPAALSDQHGAESAGSDKPKE